MGQVLSGLQEVPGTKFQDWASQKTRDNLSRGTMKDLGAIQDGEPETILERARGSTGNGIRGSGSGSGFVRIKLTN